MSMNMLNGIPQGKFLISLGLVFSAALAWSGVFNASAVALVKALEGAAGAAAKEGGVTHTLIVALVVTAIVVLVTYQLNLPKYRGYQRESPPTPAV